MTSRCSKRTRVRGSAPGALLVGLSCALAGCSSSDGGEGGRPGATSGAGSHAGGSGNAVGGSATGGVSEVPEGCGERSLPAQPLRRLSSTQYANTLTALFGATLAAQLLPDSVFPVTQINAGFSADAEPNIVSTAESNAIEDEAERIAELVLAAPAPFLRESMPCELPEPVTDAAIAACLPAFIAEFGERAYRRPLTDGEQALARRVYDELQAEQGALPAWSAVLQFFLQGPALLYRVERGAEAVLPGLVRLTDHEMASRLSFLLRDAPPDAELMAAAAAGELSRTPQILAQAERLLDAPELDGVLAGFHRDWLQQYGLAGLEKDATLFPDFESARPSLEREAGELARFVFRSGGNVANLLGGAEIPVDSTLAAWYGVPAPSQDWQAVALPNRRGVFTLASSMATLSTRNRTSAIRRGAFFQREVLCRELPSLPGNVDTQTALQDTSGLPTARERLAPLLAPGQCAGCHQLFNPTGLAFESYDAVGQWRSQEQGETIDTAGSLELDGQTVDFATPVELMERVSASTEARDCYALQWYRFAAGRREFAEDSCSLAALREASAASHGELRGLILGLIRTDGFLYRREVEL